MAVLQLGTIRSQEINMFLIEKKRIYGLDFRYWTTLVLLFPMIFNA